jgi:hypothetical protein
MQRVSLMVRKMSVAAWARLGALDIADDLGPLNQAMCEICREVLHLKEMTLSMSWDRPTGEWFWWIRNRGWNPDQDVSGLFCATCREKFDSLIFMRHLNTQICSRLVVHLNTALVKYLFAIPKDLLHLISSYRARY